jgi:predicted nucleic-acid-binding protein
VLRFSYRLSPSAISDAFDGLLSAASVTIEDVTAVRVAVAAHRAGMDFADALHVASSLSATTFSTFDKKLARHAGRAKMPVPVAVL